MDNTENINRAINVIKAVPMSDSCHLDAWQDNGASISLSFSGATEEDMRACADALAACGFENIKRYVISDLDCAGIIAEIAD